MSTGRPAWFGYDFGDGDSRTVLAVEAESALSSVVVERERQIEKEGWSTANDDINRTGGELARAAACYALAGMGGNGPFWIDPLLVPRQVWPYRWEWNPKDRRANLVRAGALILAEIERLDRAEAQS